MDNRFHRLQLRMLIMTMVGYTLFYFLRKNFSVAMPGLAQDYGITKTSLGIFLTLHGIVYGLAKFANGYFGDRARPRGFLMTGLLACLALNVAFGFVPLFEIADFAKICEAHHGLLCKVTEDYLLANAPRIEIGEPKELVKERIIRLA